MFVPERSSNYRHYIQKGCCAFICQVITGNQLLWCSRTCNITVFLFWEPSRCPLNLAEVCFSSVLQSFLCFATLIYGPHNWTCTYCSTSKSVFRCHVRKQPSSSDVFWFRAASACGPLPGWNETTVVDSAAKWPRLDLFCRTRPCLLQVVAK